MYKKIIAILLIIASFALSSCGEDDPGYPNRPSYPDNPDIPAQSGTDKNENQSDVVEILNSSVKASAKYSKYYWTVDIEISPNEWLEKKGAEYLIFHGRKDDNNPVSITPIQRDEIKSGNNIIRYHWPFYYYFMYQIFALEELYGKNDFRVEEYREKKAYAEMFLSSYEALEKKTSLSESERELFNDLKDELGKLEKETDYSYLVTAGAYVDKKVYKISSWTRK